MAVFMTELTLLLYTTNYKVHHYMDQRMSLPSPTVVSSLLFFLTPRI
jgi:hypothetical protein